MRSGFVCLLVGAGCNSIFGSHDVINGSKDADLRPKDAAPYTLYLTGMNVDTTTNPDPTQVMPTFPPLVGATVAAGPVGQATRPLDLSGDGSFSIPYDLAQGVYRVIYTPPDGVPVELQEQPQAAHFVVPSLGRPDAVNAPSYAQVGALTPQNGPTTYVNLHVFSIGTFAVRIPGGPLSAISSATTWTPNANQVDAITSLSGGLDTPESAKGDRIVVLDGQTGDTDTMSAFSVGTMSHFDVSLGADLTLTPWKTGTTPTTDRLRWSLDELSPNNARDRVRNAASNRASPDMTDGSSNLGAFLYAGVVPSLKLPAFIESGRGWQVAPGNRWAARGTGGVGVPVFLPMSKTVSTNPVTMIRAFDGTSLPAFPTAMFTRYSMSWTWAIGGNASNTVTFSEGLQAVTPVTPNLATTTPLALTVGIANTSQHMTLGGNDIWTPVDTARQIAASGAATLDFQYAVDGPIDDCVATIYRLDGTAIVPVHRFLSTAAPATTPLKIDASIFDGSHEYVFGVVCHQGLPGVKPTATQPGYDWTQVAYPFMESTLYSYPFRVQ